MDFFLDVMDSLDVDDNVVGVEESFEELEASILQLISDCETPKKTPEVPGENNLVSKKFHNVTNSDFKISKSLKEKTNTFNQTSTTDAIHNPFSPARIRTGFLSSTPMKSLNVNGVNLPFTEIKVSVDVNNNRRTINEGTNKENLKHDGHFVNVSSQVSYFPLQNNGNIGVQLPSQLPSPIAVKTFDSTVIGPEAKLLSTPIMDQINFSRNDKTENSGDVISLSDTSLDLSNQTWCPGPSTKLRSVIVMPELQRTNEPPINIPKTDKGNLIWAKRISRNLCSENNNTMPANKCSGFFQTAEKTNYKEESVTCQGKRATNDLNTNMEKFAPETNYTAKVEDKGIEPMESNGNSKKSSISPPVIDKKQQLNCMKNKFGEIESIRGSTVDKKAQNAIDMIPQSIPMTVSSNNLPLITPRILIDEKAHELSLLEEMKDNEDPGWEDIRILKTDEERYKKVREVWQFKQIPNPKRNLTYHSFRKRRLAALEPLGTDTVKLSGTKRSADVSAIDKRSTKRMRTRSVPCTEIIDHKIDEVQNQYIQASDAAGEKYVKQNDNLTCQHQQELSRMQRSHDSDPMVLYDPYHSQHLMNAQYRLDQKLEDEKNKLYHHYLNQKKSVEESLGVKVNKLQKAREEIINFQCFYQGLTGSGEGNDPTVVTEGEMRELQEIEKVYESINLLYKYDH